MVNKLYGSTVYLAGPMDRVPDGGRDWRVWITPLLQEYGIIVFDPLNKPIEIGTEDSENRDIRKELKQAGEFDSVASIMKEIRAVDLRMVDCSHFIICYMDIDVHMCGTYEEIFWANRMKRPVLIMCKQGKSEVPDWLFGVFPHSHMFGSWDDLLQYIHNINNGSLKDSTNRWMFFNFQKMLLPIVSNRVL